MSANDLRKVIQQSGLTISPSVTDQAGDTANEPLGCAFCSASWGCLAGGACASGCESGNGCEIGCWLASCNADCNAGSCSCSY